MSVLILRPNSDSSVTQRRSTGSDNYALVDEETKDESDYCYVDSNANGGSESLLDYYGLPNHTTESGTINSVTVKVYLKWVPIVGVDNFSQYQLRIMMGGVAYNSPGTPNAADTTTLYSYTWTVNPNNSPNAWTWTNIDDLLAGTYLHAGYFSGKNAGRTYNYQLWVEVDYTEGGGSPIVIPQIQIF